MDLDSLIREVLSQASAAGGRKRAESEKDRLLRERLARRAEEGATGRTRMQEEGATGRTAMQYGPGGSSDRTDAGTTARTKMAEEGATGRTGMQEAGATTRTNIQWGPGGASDRNETGMMARERLREASITERTGMTETGATTRDAMRYAPGGQEDRNIAGRSDVTTIGMGAANKDPASAFIHEAIKGDSTIATDTTPDKVTGKTRFQSLMDNSRSLTGPTKDTVVGYNNPDPLKSADTTIGTPALGTTAGTASAITPARKTLIPAPDVSWNSKPAVFGESPRLELNQRAPVYISPAQQAEDERNRKKKRMFGF